VSKLGRLEDQDPSSQSSDGERTPSGDRGVDDQRGHPRQAVTAGPATRPDDAASSPNDKSAVVGDGQDRDPKLLGYLQELERLHPELEPDGVRDIKLALQQGRIAELRAQRDLERTFEQTRMVVIDEQLKMAAVKARRRQQQSLLLVCSLIPVAVLVGGLLYSPHPADNLVLWAIAGTTFFMSYAAIVLFAVTSLGTVAEMVQLIRLQFRSAEQTPAGVTTGSSPTLSFDELRDRYGQQK
jgi:hypothetical protein